MSSVWFPFVYLQVIKGDPSEEDHQEDVLEEVVDDKLYVYIIDSLQKKKNVFFYLFISFSQLVLNADFCLIIVFLYTIFYPSYNHYGIRY